MIKEVAVEASKTIGGAWVVEAIGPDGEIYQAIFIGPDAEGRATHYAHTRYPEHF